MEMFKDRMATVFVALSPVLIPALFIAVLILVGLIWAALSGDASGGCTYGTPGCDDPSWQNVSPGF